MWNKNDHRLESTKEDRIKIVLSLKTTYIGMRLAWRLFVWGFVIKKGGNSSEWILK